MLTDLQVANLALQRLGCEPISSLSENKKTARTMNNLVEIVRYQLLESHPWGFALKRATITNNGNTPAFEFTYEFDKPADLLSIVEEYNDEEYYEEGDKILANAETLKIQYLYKEEDPEKFSASFDKAYYLFLAAEASFNLTNDKSLKQQLIDEGEFYVDRAMSYNSKGSSPKDYEFDVFTGSRL